MVIRVFKFTILSILVSKKVSEMNERNYNKQTKEAARLFGSLIELARKKRAFTTTEVAERAGISRRTLRRIENGDLRSEIGLFFEVAVIVGVPLFGAEPRMLQNELAHAREKLSLLPKNIHKPRRGVKDDF